MTTGGLWSGSRVRVRPAQGQNDHAHVGDCKGWRVDPGSGFGDRPPGSWADLCGRRSHSVRFREMQGGPLHVTDPPTGRTHASRPGPRSGAAVSYEVGRKVSEC